MVLCDDERGLNRQVSILCVPILSESLWYSVSLKDNKL